MSGYDEIGERLVMSDLITRYAVPVPRYTSYPTAPHFHAGIDAGVYGRWLEELPDGATLSLYAHIPFCDTLCWFCGCHTKITRQYQPIASYLEALDTEIATVAGAIAGGTMIRHIHWGGGSPTILSASDISRLIDTMRRHFNLAEDLDFAVEIDPRGLDRARIDALAAAGLTRISVGVQDFDPKVQARINRVQSVDETRAVIDTFRDQGVTSLNIDAIYGLPGQHEAELIHTLTEIVRMRPDRIALFGYAHVPWMKRHQTMIDEADLPDVVERHNHAELAAQFLVDNGYARVGIDHFALPHDTLAVAARDGRLHRNFQGYTADEANALIGLGASSIGRLPGGYVQNAPTVAEYARRIANGGFATTRGVTLSEDDLVRAHVIERLMCDLSFSRAEVLRRFGSAAQPVIGTAAQLGHAERDGLVRVIDDGFVITERGRPFARAIAARFDAHLADSPARHSLAV
jgi:oxygen-independent coproporphyrinogen III oxidase